LGLPGKNGSPQKYGFAGSLPEWVSRTTALMSGEGGGREAGAGPFLAVLR